MQKNIVQENKEHVNKIQKSKEQEDRVKKRWRTWKDKLHKVNDNKVDAKK